MSSRVVVLDNCSGTLRSAQRALRQAVEYDARVTGVPSTKGAL